MATLYLLVSAFQLMLVLLMASEGETKFKSAKVSAKAVSSNTIKEKKIRNAQTVPNGAFTFGGRLEYTWDRNAGFAGGHMCSGSFVSFSGFANRRKFYFITAAHCFDAVIKVTTSTAWIKGTHFNVIRSGTGRIGYGPLRSDQTFLTQSQSDPLTLYQLVDPKVNPIRTNKDYILGYSFRRSGINTDMAAIELTDTQSEQIMLDGGTFVKGESNAYIGTPHANENCTLIGRGGAQMVAVGAETNICINYAHLKKGIDHICLEVLWKPTGVRPELEHGDSARIYCNV